MKILARTVLMLLALGFGTFGDLFESTNVNSVNSAIVIEGGDGDGDLDETKGCPFSGDDAVLFSTPRLGKVTSIQIPKRLLDTSSLAWYQTVFSLPPRLERIYLPFRASTFTYVD
jgi:hypothetical protein